VENNPADCHGHQQQTGKKQKQPGHDPPDAGLRGQNAPLGLKTVCLAQYPGQQQEETYRKHEPGHGFSSVKSFIFASARDPCGMI
jgi:hypothetical protein